MIPEDGYGSYNCMVIKQQGGDLELHNSDNYVRSVLEGYWRNMCWLGHFGPGRSETRESWD